MTSAYVVTASVEIVFLVALAVIQVSLVEFYKLISFIHYICRYFSSLLIK